MTDAPPPAPIAPAPDSRTATSQTGISPESTLRARLERFFAVEGPAALDGVEGALARAKAWRAALADAGLAGLAGEADLLYRDVGAGRIPPEDAVFGIGVGMALPTIRDIGPDALRDRFLGPGFRGEEVWCQLYSEPGAGSDLAGLQTSATLDGDEWVVRGQKVWTSGAQHADLAILLARTDPDAPKHRGITMFVLPMHQPGVTVRPLVQMTGEAEFNEVFLDDARVPRDWVVGAVNDGWRLAVALLAHERQQTGVNTTGSSFAEERRKSGRSPLPFGELAALATAGGRQTDPTVRQQLARVHTGEQIISWLRHRGVHPSIGKLWRTQQGRLAADVAATLAFPAGPAWTAEDAEADFWAYHVLNCRAMSIGGGTDEIQRSTLGERALGLPREPAGDLDVPFRALRHNAVGERTPPGS